MFKCGNFSKDYDYAVFLITFCYYFLSYFVGEICTIVFSQPPYKLELRRFSIENEIYFLQREAWSLLFSIALSYKGFTYIYHQPKELVKVVTAS